MDAPHRIDLTNGNGSHAFDSWDHFRKWLQAELDHWEPFSSLQNATWNAFAPTLNNYVHMPNPDTSPFPAKWDKIASNIVSLYAKGFPHRESPRGRAISDLKATDPVAAAGMWAYFSRAEISGLNRPSTYRGILLGHAMEESAGVAVATGGLAAINDTYNSASAWFTSAKIDTNRILSEATTTRAEMLDTIRRAREEIDNLIAKTTNDVEATKRAAEFQYGEVLTRADARMTALLDDHKSRLDSLETTFSEKLAVDAPVTYWTAKRQHHKMQAIVFGIIFGLAVTTAALLSYFFLGRLLPSDSTTASLPIAPIAESVVLITLMIWIVKTIARLFLINLHLYTDASERVVMISTYLAFLKDGKSVADNDRTAILDALFRKSSTGIVKDDANPPLFLGQLRKPPD